MIEEILAGIGCLTLAKWVFIACFSAYDEWVRFYDQPDVE